MVGDADVRVQPLVVRARIGFLAASMGLYERLTPVELLQYFGRLHRMEEPALDRRVADLVHVFGITPFASQRCGTLSTGQAQRVSVARALVHDPPALILDEPGVQLPGDKRLANLKKTGDGPLSITTALFDDLRGRAGG